MLIEFKQRFFQQILKKISLFNSIVYLFFIIYILLFQVAFGINNIEKQNCEESFNEFCAEFDISLLSVQQKCFKDNQLAFSNICKKYFSKKLSVPLQNYKNKETQKATSATNNDKNYNFAINLLFSTYCKYDVARFCKLKRNRKTDNQATNNNECLNKLIKKEKYLSANCRASIYNAITGEKESYINYNIGNLTLSKRKSLNTITHEQIKNSVLNNDTTNIDEESLLDDGLDEYVEEDKKNSLEKINFPDGSWIYKKYWLAVNKKLSKQTGNMSEKSYHEFIRRYLKDNGYLHNN